MSRVSTTLVPVLQVHTDESIPLWVLGIWTQVLRLMGLHTSTVCTASSCHLLSLYIFALFHRTANLFPKAMHHFTPVLIKDSAGILSLDTQHRLHLRCSLNCVPYRNISNTNSQYLCNRPYLEIIFVDNPVKITSLELTRIQYNSALKKKLAMSWMWTSGLQNYETINFCCLTQLLAFC